MPTIDIRVDAGDTKRAMDDFTAQLQSVDARIGAVTSKINTFDAAGIQMGSVVRGVTKDGKEFTAVFRVQRDSLGNLIPEIDKVTKAFLGYKVALSSISYKEKTKDAADLSKETFTLASAFQRAARSAQYFVAYRAFSFISNQIHDGIKAAKDFQIQLSLIRTISQDSQQTFSKFGRDVRNISDSSGIGLQDVGKAFYDTASNQIAKGADIAPFVKAATDLARVTGSELPDATNLLSSAMNAYGFSVTEAERLSAVFFKTIDEGRVVASELANTYGRVAVIGANMGISAEDLNATIAITTQKGFKTADALTLLTNLMVKLEKPTTSTQAFFKSLGVETGESAIKMLGFTGVLKKMVEAVKSGQVDVSAFFDEIRGRKQFGVFEQSIDQITRFSEELKNTSSVMATYNNAKQIRGESPADKLVKEFNALSNVFRADFGQEVLRNAANLLEFTGGVKTVTTAVNEFGKFLEVGVISLGVYAASAVLSATANGTLATSFGLVGRSAAALGPLLAIPIAAYVGYELIGNRLLELNKKDPFKLNPESINSTVEALERLRKTQNQQNLKSEDSNIFTGLDKQTKDLSETYKQVLGLTAKANIANNKLLDEAREKGLRTSEVLKVSFGGYTDALKGKINDFKKGITEANNEIDKSKKSMLGFKESLDNILFSTKLQYANDDFGGQKIQVTEERIAALKKRIAELYQAGTPEAVDQARKLFDEVASLTKDNFDRQQEIRKRSLEQSLRDDPQSGLDGPIAIAVDPTELQNRLTALANERQQYENNVVRSQEAQVKNGEKLVAVETEKLRKLQAAFKTYEALDVFNKEGKVKDEFRGASGKFDPNKLTAEINRVESEIRGNVDVTFTERLQLENLLASKRQALFREAQAQENAEYFKTVQSRLAGEEEVYQTKLKKIKEERKTGADTQEKLISDLAAKSEELKGFRANVVNAGVDITVGMDLRIEEFNKALTRLQTNRQNISGVPLVDPEEVRRVDAAYRDAIDFIEKKRIESNNLAANVLQGPDGKAIVPGFAKEALGQQIKELNDTRNKLFQGLIDESIGKETFERDVTKKIEVLKSQFPDLATTAQQSNAITGQSFRDLANGGVADLYEKLKAVKELMKETAAPVNQGSIGGLFPSFAAGGPIRGGRGIDQRLIWAADGEFIVNPQASRLYRPFLEAINRPTPFMASGGSVGDTNVGDINVTVNNSGGSVNGRTIARQLEREIRRRTINLKGK